MDTMFGMDIRNADFDWDAWKGEVEKRLVGAEVEAHNDRVAAGIVRDRLDKVRARLDDVIDQLVDNGAISGERGVHELQGIANLCNVEIDDGNGTVVVPQKDDDAAPTPDGSVTVMLTPATGGLYGIAKPHEDDAPQDDAPAPQQPAPHVSTTSVSKQRAPRVKAWVAERDILAALDTMHGMTIFGIVTHTGMTTSQVRTTLTRMEQDGKVRVVGKTGKRELWSKNN